jgi:hypothetical protein
MIGAWGRGELSYVPSKSTHYVVGSMNILINNFKTVWYVFIDSEIYIHSGIYKGKSRDFHPGNIVD